MNTKQRYVLNVKERLAHDRDNLKEECNTDQIKRKKYSDEVPVSFRRCEHCMGETVTGTASAGLPAFSSSSNVTLDTDTETVA